MGGRVLGPEGAPRAGVLVWIRLRRDHRARTDSDGRYAFDDLPQGPIAVVAVPDDPDLAPAMVRTTEPGRAPDIALQRARAVEGVVVDAQGTPIADALVRVASRIRPAIALTDESGRFVLTGRPDLDERIVVTRPGYVAARAMLQAQNVSPLRVRLVALKRE